MSGGQARLWNCVLIKSVYKLLSFQLVCICNVIFCSEHNDDDQKD